MARMTGRGGLVAGTAGTMQDAILPPGGEGPGGIFIKRRNLDKDSQAHGEDHAKTQGSARRRQRVR